MHFLRGRRRGKAPRHWAWRTLMTPPLAVGSTSKANGSAWYCADGTAPRQWAWRTLIARR